jgi:TolA-binding protein
LSAARSDTIAFSNGLSYPGVQIDRIAGGQVYYRLDGDLMNKPAGDITSITVDDVPDFNTGESAYESGNYPAAAESLGRAISSTDKPWLKAFIAPRLIDAASHTGQFDLAVEGWVALALQDASSAASLRPAIPVGSTTGGPNSALDAAAAELADAGKSAQGDAQRLILGLLLDVQSARGDNDAASAVAQQLTALTPAGGSSGSPDALVAQHARLALARTALYNKEFDKAAGLIDDNADLMTDSAVQADALFIKAQALEGEADSSDRWKDAALAYMRVYVNFRDGADSSHAPESLMKVAEIEETHLGEPLAALTIYRKVAAEYKDTAAAQDAATEIARLTNK